MKFYLWVGLAFLLMGLLSNLAKNHNAFPQRLMNNIWAVVYVTALNYTLFEFTLPMLSRKKILKSLLRIFVYCILYSWGASLWKSIGTSLHIYTVFTTSRDKAIDDSLAYSESSVIFFGIIWHIYNHIKLKQAAQQLRIEKQEAELNFLKSQTNPHFLFNTLNNIYSLARDKSDQAPESILRLSKILRFMLYEAGGSYIAIEEELKIISDYIALERLRYDDTLRINFNHDIEDKKQALPPLLLMPLVENAFKHGVSETRSHPFVDIHLSVNKRQLLFFVKNSSEALTGEDMVKEHIGLSNLRRQLQLLYTDYSLLVQQVEFHFIATLKINLASHV